MALGFLVLQINKIFDWSVSGGLFRQRNGLGYDVAFFVVQTLTDEGQVMVKMH